MGTPRRYRAKLEVLRDLVLAAAREPRKTRIIGLANLNRSSFDRYVRLAISLGLLEHRGAGYAPTALAEGWLEAVDSVLGKGTELSTALGQLSQITVRGSRAKAGPSSFDRDSTVRSIARLAWSNLTVPELTEGMAARSGAILTVPSDRSPSPVRARTPPPLSEGETGRGLRMARR